MGTEDDTGDGGVDSPERIDRARGWQARAQARRNAEERKAAGLEGRGWLCVPPEAAGAARSALNGTNAQ